ncbi:MAG TPA: hypothetical protein VGA66_12265 [Mycobacterium sp.]
MRRQSAAVIGMVATFMSAAFTPSASADLEAYPPNQYLLTTGNVRCVVSAERAACERMGPEGFPAAPANQSGGGHWHVAAVDADGKFSWDEAGIGPSTSQEIVLVNGQPYHFHDWTLLLTTEGTRLSNDANTHGMNVSIDGTVVTPY